MARPGKPATILLLTLLTASMLLPGSVHVLAYLSITPPTLTELWERSLGGLVSSVSWGPGVGLAVGASHAVIVLNGNGSVLWEGKLAEDVLSVSWSHNGDRLVVGVGWFSWLGNSSITNSTHGRIIVFSNTSKKVWQSMDLYGYVYSVSWSPKDDRLAVGAGSRIIVFNSSGGVLWEKSLGSNVSSVSWSPSGDKLVVGGDFRKIAVFDVKGNLLWEKGTGGRVSSVSWSPSNSEIAASIGNRIIVFNAEGGVLWEQSLGSSIRSVSWSPGGDMLAVTAGNYAIVFDSSGNLLWKSRNLGGLAESISWSPEGSKLVVGVDNRVVVLYASFGVIQVSGVPGSVVSVSGPGGSGEYKIPGNQTLTLYATPGNYTINYKLPQPNNYIGTRSPFSGSLKTDVKPGKRHVINLPSYGDLLARLELAVPPYSSVTLESGAVKKTFSAGGDGKLLLWLDPGAYKLTVTYKGATVSRDLKVSKGQSITLKFGEQDFAAPITTTTSKPTTSTQSQASGATIPPIATTTSHTLSTATPVETAVTVGPTTTMVARGGLGGYTLLLGLLGLGGVMAAVILLRRKSGGETLPGEAPPQAPPPPPPPTPESASSSQSVETGRVSHTVDTVEGPSTPVKTPASTPVGGLKSVASLLGRELQGFKSVESCRGSYSVVLPESLAPQGFGGSWDCCKLGCGGWGCAYRCRRSGDSSGEYVVFKVPRGLEALIEEGSFLTIDERLLRRVVNEASVVSRLKHPHVLRLLAYGEKLPLLVYEYADMGSLDQQFALGWSPSLRDSVLAALQLGDALRYIHSRGLVHGDIKPGNIFVRDGVVKLGDFSSLVRLVTMTSRHALSYTPGFRAPEQVFSDLKLRAVRAGLENRIDVYQLGNLLLYMISGETIDGEEAADASRVEEVLRGVEHPVLRELLRRMLSLEPEERPNMEYVVVKLYEVYEGLG
ncbi:MAG: protein kinase [Desulfurococcales archaeon]|nr:protein kinase [Desulfurococcales archaeon]